MSYDSRLIVQYTLETWSEARRTDWAHEPFVGQPVDPPSNGPAPPPFDVFIAPPAPFTPHRASAEVPHTASVKVLVCKALPA